MCLLKNQQRRQLVVAKRRQLVNGGEDAGGSTKQFFYYKSKGTAAIIPYENFSEWLEQLWKQAQSCASSSASSSSSSSSSTPRTLALHESTSASVSTTLALAAKGLQAVEQARDALKEEEVMRAGAEGTDTDEASQLGPGNESAQGLRVAALEAKLPDAIEQITYYSTLVAKLQPAPAADALQSGACHMSMQVVRDAAEQPVEDCGALDAAMGANEGAPAPLSSFGGIASTQMKTASAVTSTTVAGKRKLGDADGYGEADGGGDAGEGKAPAVRKIWKKGK